MTDIRFITDDERAAYLDAIQVGFGDDPVSDPPGTEIASVDRFFAINPIETSIAAFDRGRPVATFGSYDLDMTVPGGASVATAGTTHVTVHPTHRRRGILTEMMRLHLDQARDRGQAMAVLWASEDRIYGRFGYGPATWALDLSVAARAIEFPPGDPAISLHPLTDDEARAVLPPFFATGRTAVAGRFERTDEWWTHRRFHDRGGAKGAKRKLRHVAAERDGETVGYLTYRLAADGDWTEGRTGIIELMAADDEVRRALLHFATNVDLFRNVQWWNAPTDEPFLIEADHFRAAKYTTFDAMWVRPLDVAALLSARTYDRDGSITIHVDDPLGYTGGRFRLEVDAGQGRCVSVDGGASGSGDDSGAGGAAAGTIALGVADLGRLYMGAGSAVALARAGRIDGAPTDVAVLDDLLRTRTAPHCAEVF